MDPNGASSPAANHADVGAAANRARRALVAIIQSIEASAGKPRVSLLGQLRLQVVGLRRIEAAAAEGAMPRHVWSLGQASLPVLPILLDVISSRGTSIPEDLGKEFGVAAIELADVLRRFAEGR